MSQNPGVKESWYRLPLPIARKAHPRAPDSGYPLGRESLSEAQSWVIERRLFPDTRVTAFRLAA
jgi:hypothetical protein